MLNNLENMSASQLKSFTYNTKDPVVLTELSNHPDIEIRKEVIFNPYTPLCVLERMKSDGLNLSLEGFLKRAVTEKKKGSSLRNVFIEYDSDDKYDDDLYPSY